MVDGEEYKVGDVVYYNGSRGKLLVRVMDIFRPGSSTWSGVDYSLRIIKVISDPNEGRSNHEFVGDTFRRSSFFLTPRPALEQLAEAAE